MGKPHNGPETAPQWRPVPKPDRVLGIALHNAQEAAQAVRRLAACLAPLAEKYPEVELVLERFDWGEIGGIADVEEFVSEHYFSGLLMRDAAIVARQFGWYCASLLSLLRDPVTALREVRWDLFGFDPAAVLLLRRNPEMRTLVFIVAACQSLPLEELLAIYQVGTRAEVEALLSTGEAAGLFTRLSNGWCEAGPLVPHE
jgi:hypothetical protein